MIMRKPRLTQLVFAAIVAVCMIDSSSAATGANAAQGNRPPAGQMCPGGSYVIGFDSGSNIICSEASENDVLYPDETAGDGNVEIGDGCAEECQSEEVDAGSAGEAIIAETILTNPESSPSIPELIITDVEPSTALYGSSEVTITVSGAGFGAESVIIFAGSRYLPSVNQAGTRLDVTIPMRNLSIGPYAITISNGPGMETTRKKALVIF